MKPIASIISELNLEKEKAKLTFLYPRQELIKQFVDILNRDRIENNMRPLSAAFIASRMYQSGLNTDFLLHWFFGYCKDAKNFSKCWWWALKHK